MKFYHKTKKEYWIDALNEGANYGGFDTNIPYSDHETFKEICDEHHLGYYAKPEEKFFMQDAFELLDKHNYTYLLLENLS